MAIDESGHDIDARRSGGRLRGGLDLALGYLSALLALVVQMSLLWLVFKQFSVLGQAEKIWSERTATVPTATEPYLARPTQPQPEALTMAIAQLNEASISLEIVAGNLKQLGDDAKIAKSELDATLKSLGAALSVARHGKDFSILFPLGDNSPAKELKSLPSNPGSEGAP